MRILMLGPHPNVRGPILGHTLHLIRALEALGCEVTLMPWGRHSDSEGRAAKVTGRARDIVSIRRALRRQSFDMLIVKTAPDWSGLSRDIPLLLATRRLCPHTVLQFHGSLADRLVAPGSHALKIASALLVRLSDAALVLSFQEQRQWQAFYPQGRFYVVANPFVPALERSLPMDRSALGIPADVPVLLFVGRLIEAKGIFELVEAMARAQALAPCHLLVAGDGVDRTRMQERVTSLALDRNVTFAGYLQGHELLAAYGSADAFVLPSWAEGFPVAVQQAMDAGLPVITTRIRGMADHLVDGVNGLLIPVRDVEALTRAIVRLSGDPALREQMSRANRVKVHDFAPEPVARHYLDTLLAIAGRARKAVPAAAPGQV